MPKSFFKKNSSGIIQSLAGGGYEGSCLSQGYSSESEQNSCTSSPLKEDSELPEDV